MQRLERRERRLIYVAVAVAVVASILFAPSLLPDGDGYGDVTVQEARTLIEDKPDLVILDVRTASEYEDGHIEGAINIPVQELGDRLDELSRDDELLVYCRTGNRSAQAVGILRDAGFAKIYHMNAGITG
ncbi:MAG TPA: rhodanese-like domain-containing protein [Candidatus Krumholzibacteriaceae bacterium]|nr:rhodanese-like domain-containing protein [Candidatus Krumholzibacteriaceae bacterium]